MNMNTSLFFIELLFSNLFIFEENKKTNRSKEK